MMTERWWGNGKKWVLRYRSWLGAPFAPPSRTWPAELMLSSHMAYIYSPVFHPPRLPVDVSEHLETSDCFSTGISMKLTCWLLNSTKAHRKALDDPDAPLGCILHIESILESRIKKIQFFLNLFRPKWLLMSTSEFFCDVAWVVCEFLRVWTFPEMSSQEQVCCGLVIKLLLVSGV